MYDSGNKKRYQELKENIYGKKKIEKKQTKKKVIATNRTT